jgi:hypothetical protein
VLADYYGRIGCRTIKVKTPLVVLDGYVAYHDIAPPDGTAALIDQGI